METDPLAWLASQAGFPVLDCSADGEVHASEQAARYFAAGAPRTAEEGIEAITGPSPRARRLLQQARGGQANTVELPEWVLAAFPTGPQSCRIVLLPRTASSHTSSPQACAECQRVSGVAHEVANTLTSLRGWAQLAQEHPSYIPEALRLIERSAGTAREAARGFIERDSSTAPNTWVDALEVAQEATQLLQADARARQVELTSELGGSCRIRGDRSALFTVVSNLARNAVEAVDDGGHVHVQVQREGDQVDIGVRDDGPGMSPGTQQEIFVQHFTTKTGGAGLGLGLVRRAVDSLGGSLQVRSDPGQGTSIHVLLPAHDLRGQEQTEETDSLRLPLRRYSGVQERRPSRIEGEVLIVEDDPALRELMLTTLQMRGANVTAAVNVAEAFQYPGPYDVALIDLTLPDGRGDELLAELRRRGAVRSAALVSGAEPTGLDGAAAPDTWLRKPFDPVDLIATAAELARSAGDSNRTQGQSG